MVLLYVGIARCVLLKPSHYTLRLYIPSRKPKSPILSAIANFPCQHDLYDRDNDHDRPMDSFQ